MQSNSAIKQQFYSTIRDFQESENYKKSRMQEEVLRLLFCTPSWSANTDLKKIYAKVSVLNDFYSTNIYDTFGVSEAILGIKDFDQKLHNGNLNVVTELSKKWFQNKKRNILSFASKYCANHEPDLFPIYDSFVSAELWKQHKKDNFIDDKTITSQSAFFKKVSEDYVFFAKTIKTFQQHYDLSDCSIRDIDFFLWCKGKKHKESDKRLSNKA